MLTEKQLQEIRGHLENAKNPVFFFDNDADGVCSFLILQRFIGRGKGISLKGIPSLQKEYFKRVEELGADYIFCLDRPSIDKDFMRLAEEKGLPVVCIDHHQYEGELIENYYNTFHASGKNEPTSYLCYMATGRKEDMWLAVIGCIGDGFIPEFFEEFKKQHPELIDAPYKTAFDISFKTRLGKIISVINLALKDKTSNIVSFLKFMIKAGSPHDLLEENSKTKGFLKRYEYLKKCVDKIVEKAERQVDKKKKILFFTYGGEMSLSQHVSDDLMYHYPDIIIAVGFVKGNSAKFSLRWSSDIRTLAMSAIKNIDGATGGGHKNSCGVQMTADSVPKFRENLLELTGKTND